jgi:hypothetical protein
MRSRTFPESSRTFFLITHSTTTTCGRALFPIKQIVIIDTFRPIIPFAYYSARVEQLIEKAYSVRVVTRDVPDPLICDLNGAEIHIDYAVTPEQRLFLLAHLFGHTVRWNVNVGAFELGRPQFPPVRECTSRPANTTHPTDHIQKVLGFFPDRRKAALWKLAKSWQRRELS